jgi:hypothetical protein
MTDPVDEAIAKAQTAAFTAIPAGGAKVTPIRGGIASIPDGPVCQAVDAFLNDGDAPEWVVAGILQTNYVYALTAPTNHGKTAVSLVMALCVAAGRLFAGRQVKQGNVLILCGENQDGFRLRMRATMESLEISLNDIRHRVWVLPQSTGLAYLLEQIKKRRRHHGRPRPGAGGYLRELFYRGQRK